MVNRNATLTAVAVTFLMVAPTVGAVPWMSHGTYEPNTFYDTPAFMQQEAPGSATNKIYFNVFTKHAGLGANGATMNANVGALQTRIDPMASWSFEGILGVWTDCNGDGYVGMLETAVREYKAELLLDTSICPPKTGHINRWTQGWNNYNGWVVELIPIGGADYTPNDDKRVYSDLAAMVWGDPGRPESPAAQAGPSCPNNPLPGDAHSTGGIIYTLDCRGNRGFVAQFNELDAQAGTGLGLGDDPRESDSPLNQPTFGDDGGEHAAVHVQDCSQDAIVNSGDVPVGDDLDNVDYLRPVPSNPVNGDTSTWTVPGQLNATREEITVIHQQNNTAPPGSDSEANCDYSDDNGNDFYGNIEANAVINQENGKRNAAWNFAFNTASRGTLPATVIGAGGAGPSTDFGIEALQAFCTASSCVQSQWVGPSFIGGTPPLFRGDVANGEAPSLPAAPYWTFYANVGAATAARGFQTPGGSGKYGSAQCGSFTSGEHNGWNCNADEWYLLADGTNSRDTSPRPLAVVGQVYNLRDVDCTDGNLGVGVGISPAFFGDSPCQ